MLADTMTRSLTDVLERPDLRVIADGLVPVLDVSLLLPFRIEGPMEAGKPFRLNDVKLKLGAPCLEVPRLAPTFLRQAIELVRLLEPGANPYLASFAAARVAALFHGLDTGDVAPLPAWLSPFSGQVPSAATLFRIWDTLSALLPELPPLTEEEAARLHTVLVRLWPVLAPAETLMGEGGDSRLAVDPHTGLNRYSSSHRPRPWAVTFGSSTASSLSERGFGGQKPLGAS